MTKLAKYSIVVITVSILVTSFNLLMFIRNDVTTCPKTISSVKDVHDSPPPLELLTFYLVWSTSRESYDKRIHGGVIDSIIANHEKEATEIIVVTNSLLIEDFDDFIKLGYKIKLLPMDIDTITYGTYLNSWINEYNYTKHMDHKNYYSHVTDIIRVALLYKYGGVYIDYDAIVTKNLRNLGNIISDHDAPGKFANGAVMKFSQGHPFLAFILEQIPKKQNIDDWNSIGPKLIFTSLDQWQQFGPEYIVRLPTSNLTVIEPHRDLKSAFSLYRLCDEGRNVFYRNYIAKIHDSYEKSYMKQHFDANEFNVTMQTSAVYHYFNSWKKRDKRPIEDGSLIAEIFRANCIVCYFKDQS
jgi:hypothetical protein